MPEPTTATKTARDRYARFLKERHRPSHGRRQARTWATFLLPSLAPGTRVLDLGCGPGSTTVGLAEAVGPEGVAVGVDLDPGRVRSSGWPTDWGGLLSAPAGPRTDRGQQILEALRPNTSPYVGRALRGLLHDAGFTDAKVTARGTGGGGPNTGFEGEFQAAMFDAPEVVDYAVEQEVASRDEMAAVAEAWRQWGRSPGAFIARHWFEATAHVPGG